MERGQPQQQPKDIASAALLELTRTRRGREKKREGLEKERRPKLGQVRQVAAPAVPEASPVANALSYLRYVDAINRRRVILLLLRLKKEKTRSDREAVSVETTKYSRAFSSRAQLVVSVSRAL